MTLREYVARLRVRTDMETWSCRDVRVTCQATQALSILQETSRIISRMLAAHISYPPLTTGGSGDDELSLVQSHGRKVVQVLRLRQ